MKTYKWLRGLLKASAFTTVMFIMQACYGTPNPKNLSLPEDAEAMELTEESDSIVQSDLQSADVEFADMQSENE